jgi:hypothetical protein
MKTSQRKARLQLLGTLGLCALLGTAAEGRHQQRNADPATCETVQPQIRGGNRVYDVGNIWSGVHTSIAAAQPNGDTLIAAYYDPDRWLTVVSADASTGTVCHVRLPNRFSGWDGHNSLAMAVAPDGTVHVAGDAHASPLFYARGFANDIATIRPSAIVGRDETSATYPEFHRDALSRLIFFYRSGGSGNGAWIADRWANGGWVRLGSSFAAVDRAGSHLSAYPSSIVVDQSGVSHVAIVWRRTPDVATNFAVGYAKTSDFLHWSGTSGRGFPGPVGPDQIDMIEQPGENAGLLNNAQLVLTPSREPVVFYTRYGAAGTDALVAAKPVNGKWTVKEIATSNRRTPIAGEGSLPGTPTFSVSANGYLAQVSVNFPGAPRASFEADLRTLQRTSSNVAPSAAAGRAAPSLLAIPAGLANASVWSQLVTSSGFDGHSKSHIFWYTQGLNRDHAWLCTAASPRACAPPPSPLLWVVPTSH